MYIYFVRHGLPDYETDTLLPEGVRQAESAARRLSYSGLDEIYTSPMGRARETARPAAELMGLPVTVLPWAYELGEESKSTWPDGIPTRLSKIDPVYYFDQSHRRLTAEEDLETLEVYLHSGFLARYREISEGLDAWLWDLGYQRTKEGFYLAAEPNQKHVALFCHCAMQRVMLSHLLNIPYHVFAATLEANYTGITILYFPSDRKGELTVPQIMTYGDVGHIHMDTKEGFVSHWTHEPF